MFVGTLTLDLLLGDIRSLKQKRAAVRPIVSEVRRRFEVAAAEVGHLELYRRTELGVAVVAADAGHCRHVLEAVERMVADRPEIEVLSAHPHVRSDEDDPLPTGGRDG
ncbi:DUF503 domain-containing protein [Actinobacteria bacterium YIM 96077]|uniref:DUF503 domain-containing protein n=1 Tax=Phytoactinopolyspora halophila TaxID=1981511 RepID=A0A329QWT2_9ACTN|nr:DUF503 domain-containing protein [Phytoactinopolyspora halophila]AYY12781.1 DUF503 domain-containing protein [Actinobacteria bacterium YIM 96077]RAW16426.1 DUF503 domain-containing protein [Phytoactinopolyspora halophila]